MAATYIASTAQVCRNALALGLVGCAATGCLISPDFTGHQESRALDKIPALDYGGNSFYGPGILVRFYRPTEWPINKESIPKAPAGPFIYFVCVLGDSGSKYEWLDLDPNKVTIEMNRKTVAATLEGPPRRGLYQGVPGKFSPGVSACWTLSFPIDAKEPLPPYVLSIKGLTTKDGSTLDLPRVSYEYVYRSPEIQCVLPGCFKPH